MTIHFVGAGPGAADLLTVRAVTRLASADLVLFPGTYIDDAVLSHCQEATRRMDTQHLDLDEIVEHMATAHDAGSEVVRLVSGDPTLYSTLTEQARRLDRLGIPWDVVPGIPAYAAAAALVGRELTVPELAQSVVLTRTQARSTAMPDTESLEAFARTRSTLALHLSIRRTRELTAELAAHYGDDCPVIVVSRAEQPDQLILRGTLADIADRVEDAELRQAAVILVGRALGEHGGGESFLYSPGRERPSRP